MKRLIGADELNKAIVDNDSIHIVNNSIIKNIYSVHLTEEIGESKHYRDLYNLLRNANDSDSFIFYLSNFGGQVHTGIEIINSMNVSPGQVITYMTGPCYSMAPLIVLSGDKIFLQNDAFMMFHDYSGSIRGKGHEQLSGVSFEKPHFDAFFKRVTKGFLKAKEVKAILKGQDLYLGKNEIEKRLQKLKKLGGEEK